MVKPQTYSIIPKLERLASDWNGLRYLLSRLFEELQFWETDLIGISEVLASSPQYFDQLTEKFTTVHLGHPGTLALKD